MPGWTSSPSLSSRRPADIDSSLIIEDLAAGYAAGNDRAKALLLKKAELQAEQEAWTPFDVARAPLFRTRLPPADPSRRAGPIARALRSGSVSINSVLTYAGMPSLPLGGVGESGFGRVHGPDGLREFTRPKAITRQRFPLPFPMQSFDRPRYVLPAVRQAMKLRHGRTPRSPGS